MTEYCIKLMEMCILYRYNYHLIVRLTSSWDSGYQINIPLEWWMSEFCSQSSLELNIKPQTVVEDSKVGDCVMIKNANNTSKIKIHDFRKHRGRLTDNSNSLHIFVKLLVHVQYSVKLVLKPLP